MAEMDSNPKSKETREGVIANPTTTSMSKTRTILWCVPRSVSTALTKCLSFVDGIEVWFEPYMFCFSASRTALSMANIDIPRVYDGNEEIYHQAVGFLDAAFHQKTKPQNISMSSVCRFLEESTSPHVFVKDIAMGMCPEDYQFLPKGYRHTFLIRHPLRVFASYRKAMYVQLLAQGVLVGEAADPVTFDIGRHVWFIDSEKLCFKEVYDAWKHVRENFDADPIVIDGEDLVTKPAELLSKYCRAIGLPYTASMLKWEASTEVVEKWVVPSEEVVGTFTFFYERATKSSEFVPSGDMPSRDELTPDVIRCADKVMKYYEEMYAARMKV